MHMRFAVVASVAALGMAAVVAAPAVATPAVPAPTTLVWDQFVPFPTSVVNYAPSGNYTQQCRTGACIYTALAIDDFTLSRTTRLTSLRGLYANTFHSFNLPDVENWQVDVFSSPTAALGFGAGDIASMIVTSGVSLSAAPPGYPPYGVGGVVTVPIDVRLPAGSYWLGLRPKIDYQNAGFALLTTAGDPNKVGNFFVTESFSSQTYAYSMPGGIYFQLSGQAVPEPASWAMLIAGFGLVGATARRRRTRRLRTAGC